MEANTELTRAVASGLGPRRTDGFFRALALESFETPLMRGLVSAVVAVVGNDPARFLDWYQRGFGLLFRGVGTWVVTERSATGATIEVTGLPAPCADEVWLASVASSLSALIVLAKRNGSVDYRWRKRPSDVDFRLVWTVDD